MKYPSGTPFYVPDGINWTSLSGYTSGYVLTATNSGGATWQPSSGGGSQWTTSGNNIYYNTGNVGIGTSTASKLLTVGSTGQATVDSSGNLSTSGTGTFTGNIGIGGAAPTNVAVNATGGITTQANLLAYGSLIGFGPGLVGTHFINAEIDQNNDTQFDLINSNGSGSAQTVFNVSNGTNGLRLQMNGTGLSGGSGTNLANEPLILSSTNLNISSGAGNVIRFGVGNVEKDRIDSNGNLGIGSTNPGQALDVAGNIRATGTNQMIVGSDNANYLSNSASSSGDLTFNTNSLERMRIGNGGGVGIGTTNTTKAALTVMNGNVGIGTWIPSASLNIIGTAGNNVLGIGTSGVNSLITVNSAGQTTISPSSTAGTPSLIFNFPASVFDGTNKFIQFQRGGGEQGDITSGGYTGNGWNGRSGIIFGASAFAGLSGSPTAIGATGAKSDVIFVDTGTNNGTNVLISNSSASVVPVIVKSIAAQTADMQEWQNSSGTVLDNITASGNIGIGTLSANASLSVIGNIGIGTIVNDSYMTTSPPKGGMIIEKNVGIGTWVPAAALDMGPSGGIRLGGITQTTWSGLTNYWSNTAASGNVGISTTNTVGIGTTAGVGAGLVVMNGNVGIGTWVPGASLSFDGACKTSGIGKDVCWGTSTSGAACIGYCTAGTFPACSTCTCC